MFRKILIANRGEIARRIQCAAQRMGIKTVAVYSEADSHSPHVKLADEAYFIGPAPAQESYLRGDKILETAKRSGAEAIHPGYGFLSENADFARDCMAQGVGFIGPSVEVLQIMGSKSASKKLAEGIGVPIIPGYYGEDQTLKTLAKEAARIGFPLLIKASAGGGGKGMRVVRETSHFMAALESAQREVEAAFKDNRLLMEKFIEDPRHIEVQIFGDSQGNRVHLYERDCSIQRRYQKIIEESPALNLSEKGREKLYEAALKIAEAVQYEGAGTVEFLMDSQENFYFMEMNTRLQVEHPVTEMIVKEDLVEWQLRVAWGEPLPLTQSQIKRKGHAVEARVCAENPAHDFLPATGTISRLDFPFNVDDIRYEIGIERDSTLSVYYDSMIAKIIAWGENRQKAIERLAKALRCFKISGTLTNKSYLLAILNHPLFIEGRFSTQFIDHYHSALLQEEAPPLMAILLAGISAVLLKSEDVPSFLINEGRFWRMNARYQEIVSYKYGSQDQEYKVAIEIEGSAVTIDYNNKSYEGQWFKQKPFPVIELLEERIEIEVQQEGSLLTLSYHDKDYAFTLTKKDLPSSFNSEEEGRLIAPMPGKIIAVKVKIGDSVKAGDSLIILEAMKMEHHIKAPCSGRVEALPYRQNDLVPEGVEVIILSKLIER